MKIDKITGLLIAIISIIAILLLSRFGIEIGPLIGSFFFFALLIAVGYIIIDGISNFANRLIDTIGKRQSIGNDEILKNVELMMQRIQVIEKKVDRIKEILEKVSD